MAIIEDDQMEDSSGSSEGSTSASSAEEEDTKPVTTPTVEKRDKGKGKSQFVRIYTFNSLS